MTATPRLLLSIGDPHGIGPELAVAAVRTSRAEPDLVPVVVGDAVAVEPYARAAGLQVRHVRDADAAVPPRDGTVDLVDVGALAAHEFQPGTVSAAAGRATVAYLARAVDAVRNGYGRGVVACPHSETAIHRAGIEFSGYPGLLARLTGTDPDRVFLMLVGGGLRITHVTLHEDLAGALRRLSPDLVETAGLATAAALRTFGVASPRLGMFGVNPHAGEDGLFGDADDVVTRPAVERLSNTGLDVVGPLGADLLVGRDDVDAFLAMYHDQGHIPVKLLAGRHAAAVSIGSGVVFSSVGHGTAFDIVGRGIADPTAVVNALRLVGGAGGDGGPGPAVASPAGHVARQPSEAVG